MVEYELEKFEIRNEHLLITFTIDITNWTSPIPGIRPPNPGSHVVRKVEGVWYSNTSGYLVDNPTLVKWLDAQERLWLWKHKDQSVGINT